MLFILFFFLMIRRPPRSTLFPTRRSSDLWAWVPGRFWYVPLGLCIARQTTAYLHTPADRKSTRLNSSHGYISYAVFCLKKKKTIRRRFPRYKTLPKQLVLAFNRPPTAIVR